MTHVLTEEELECSRGCSGYKQYYHGRRNFEKGHCPFCQIDRVLNAVLYERFGWVAWKVPQGFTSRQSSLTHQIVFFPKRHRRRPAELNLWEQFGYFRVLKWAERTFNMPGGGIVNRFGDMRYNVGTIMHMHATIMVPNRKGEVIVPLQKSPEMLAEHDARMQEFARQYEAGVIPD